MENKSENNTSKEIGIPCQSQKTLRPNGKYAEYIQACTTSDGEEVNDDTVFDDTIWPQDSASLIW